MKKTIILALLTSVLFTHVQAKDTNIETCKLYIKEAKTFQENMDTSKVSEATLAFYKEKIVTHCGTIMAKMPYDNNFFTKTLMKKDTTTVSSCKLAIAMAKKYTQNEHTSDLLVNAHKVNIVDNCGTLMAKKVPSFCSFEVADSSK